MAKQKSPHTQSQQNTNFAQTDLNPDDMPQTVMHGEDAAAYENNDGAQSGGTRSPKHMPGAGNSHNTGPQAVAYEGSVTSRTSRDASKQGISNRSAESEYGGQEKVVRDREDAQAGLNHSGKTPH
ncbi:hypothetical protein [Occallatibacter riparius]|uniref:Uncharacterized protein n=1 Tax=Occallatibacter riparius TaxID=1002689 RepID=A0A9J7BQI1_9BACT|nr:hypothetical protein [Occallatibacter riparius]UWZ84944.1 hypothetical protein MOP44_03150 [Occallatibacter riparius]